MKRALVIISLVLFALTVNAQRGRVKSLAVDTLQGNETVNFETFYATGSYNSIGIVALCEELGGTADGTLALYGSVDGTNWVFINGVGAGVVTASPQASLTGADLNQITITDGLVASWAVEGSPYMQYRITGAGTTGDTTQVTIKYVLK